MLEARGVSMCAHVCPQQELVRCVWSSTSALAVYGAQWGMWQGAGGTGGARSAWLLPDPTGCGALSCGL